MTQLQEVFHNKGLHINFECEWLHWRPGFNWYTFTPIAIECEWAEYTQRHEFRIMVLGVGFTLTYVYGDEYLLDLEERFAAAIKQRSDIDSNDK